MLFLKQPFILSVLCHKSATICQIDSCKVSNSKLKPDLRNCVKTKIFESMAPPQQPHQRGTIFFWDTLQIFHLFDVFTCISNNLDWTIIMSNRPFVRKFPPGRPIAHVGKTARAIAPIKYSGVYALFY